MAQRLDEWGLRKKFSIDKLSKVGSVYFKGNVAKPGVQRGAVLKNTLIGIGKGKISKYQLERALKLSGVAGSQSGKRNKILELVYGNEKKDMVAKTDSKKAIKTNDGKTYLTEKQVKRNLKVNMQRDESGPIDRGATYSKQYAGGQVKSHGLIGEMGIDIMERNRKIGFAADYKNKLPDNSSPKGPAIGIKPIVL